MRRALLLLTLIACKDPPPPAPPTYVAAQLCAGCHPQEAERWRGSSHDRAMELPGPSSVRGDFDGAVFEETRFLRDKERYFIEETLRDGTVERHRVEYTFGVEPLQQYLIALPGGRLQAYALAWDTRGERWFRVQSPGLHWKGRYQSWNSMCADCHSTNVDKGYDAERDEFATTFSEVDVGCQACHGPGSHHAADPKVALPARTEVEACAPCHSRRSPLTPKEKLDESSARSRFADAFTDHFRPMTLRSGLYFPDGQIRDEVFEYGSFVQSKMHQSGVRCVDCHEPHGLAPAAGNLACTSCHNAAPPVARFPALAARARDVDTPAHHHHREGSAGAQCVGCHMPERIYMGVDARHDHSFSIPRPDLELGAPNACNGCHTDRDPRWAAAKLAEWFPGPKKPHFGEVLHRAEQGRASLAEVEALARDGSQSAIVRATALELLSTDPACAREAKSALADPSPLVRSVAVACAELLDLRQRIALAAPMLADPSRLVRLEAARVLAGVPLERLSEEERQRHLAARAELDALHRSQRDRPEGSFNLALLAEAEGRYVEAIAEYERALSLDAGFLPAQHHLSQLRARLAQRALR